jgi:drug/metabolite transporter (DMT)-like permease
MSPDAVVQNPQPAAIPKAQEQLRLKGHDQVALDRYRYLVLGAIIVFSSVGDVLLAHGMKQIGAIPISDFHRLIPAVFNPWVALGIFFLLMFFAAYSTALSWADLTYVLPATSLSYVLVAIMGALILHEHISVAHWVGILLVSGGVGIVAGGPSISTQPGPQEKPCP